MKTDLNKLVELFMSDQAFLQLFICQPSMILDQYNLTEEEKRTLLVRDVNDLLCLGMCKSPSSGIESDLW